VTPAADRLRDWDAGTYDRVSEPQVAWAREVIERLELTGDEAILDAGCGSGRVTELLRQLVPRGRVVAVDGAESMVALARKRLGPDLEVRHCDLLELELAEPVDLVFSTAVFHHVSDHERLFAHVRAALRPGGRLVAQCGGAGNTARFRAKADAVARREPYATHLRDMGTPWNFVGPPETEARLVGAGFAEARCWLEPRPIEIADPGEARAFMRTVLLNYHVQRLPAELGDRFIADVARAAGEPLRVDYVRLNIEAQAA
jgi:trans-aconitate 2-methyltransferase